MGHPSQQHDPEALLAESAWLLRLAKHLVRDAHRAEDLSQEVIAVALAERTYFEGSRLRGWLAGITRHLAAHGRAQERHRSDAELRAARPEAQGCDAHERLLLHRRLAAAIDALPEPYRETLVLRYLDGLPPRAIARRKRLPATTVRKRVSRALAMLRKQLDSDFRDEAGEHGRDSWCTALIGILRRPSGADFLPTAGALAMGTTIKALAATVAVSAVLFVLVRQGASVSPPGLERALGVQPAHGEADQNGPGVPARAAAATTGGERLPVTVVDPGPAKSGPRLHIVDEDGAALPDARALWLDAREHTTPIELDAQASATLPRSGGHVLAACDGFVPGSAPLDDPGSDLVLVLDEGLEIVGRVLEDGSVPRRPLHLHIYWSSEGSVVSRTNRKLQGELEEQGFLPQDENVWTDAEGSFRFSPMLPQLRGTLRLPSSHVLADLPRYRALRGESRLPIVVDGAFLSVETSALPVIEGRLVWREDGSPVAEGVLSFAALDPGGITQGGRRSTRADTRGQFAIGLPIPDWCRLSDLERERARSEFAALHIYASTLAGDGLQAYREIPLAQVSYPHDLGTIELERAKRVQVRVLGSDGAPLAGAVVASRVAMELTDSAGEVWLACEGSAGEEVVVLARAHAMGHFLEAQAPGPEAGAWVLQLEPGVQLTIRAQDANGGPLAGARLEVSWEEAPFERSKRCRGPMDSGLHQKLSDGSSPTGSWRSDAPLGPGKNRFTVDPEGEVHLVALRPGLRIHLRLLHANGGLLMERDVVTPLQPGVEIIPLIAPEDTTSTTQRVILRGKVVDADGVGLPWAQVSTYTKGRYSSLKCDESGAFESGPLEPGTVELDVTAVGWVPWVQVEYELLPRMAPVTFTMQRARFVRVTVRDEMGRSLRLRRALARDGDGHSYLGNRTPRQVLFEEVPLAPLEVDLEIGLRKWTRPIPADVTEFVLEVPGHGTLAAEVSRAALGPGSFDLILVVEGGQDLEPVRIDS
ncbi:MAG: sigma-70 family RNA polymerase sigma factor, partial [Planctomycetota bacterium]